MPDSSLKFLHNNILKGFDKDLMTGMILIDLQKALETIEHNILLKKLRAIGFSNNTIDWSKSEISNQLFRANFENRYSNPSNITCGVPQGSILGPLLFLIYVNATKSNLSLHADNFCLAFQEKDVTEIEKQLKNLQISLNGLSIINLVFTLAKLRLISTLFAS